MRPIASDARRRARGRYFGRVPLTLLLSLTAIVPPARAQEESRAPAGETNQATTLVPPRVVHLPEVSLPPEVPQPVGGGVILRLRVDRDGRAEVEECDAEPAVCEEVGRAIEQGIFEPALRGEEPIAARIGMRFVVRADEPPASEDADRGGAIPPEGKPGTVPEGSPATAAPSLPRVAVDSAGFGARAAVEAPRRPRLQLLETNGVHDGFGGPLREIEMQPGVVSGFSGLPFFYVRGSPPSGSRFYYDGIDVPIFYHLGLGPPVIHEEMVGDVHMYAAVPPARYGRLIGGAIAAEAPAPDPRDTHAEVEARLLDSSAMVRAPVGRGHVAVAGRYGYPHLMLSIFSPDIHLEYWDYQVRAEHPVSHRDVVQLVALGSSDNFSAVHELQETVRDSEPADTLDIAFHRIEARLVRRLPNLEVATALRFGWEQADLDGDVRVEAFTVGPRMWVTLEGDHTELRIGAEMIGATGSVDASKEGLSWGQGLELSSPTRVLASVAARTTASAYAELAVSPLRELTLDLGLRTDVWTANGDTDPSVEPRARAILHLTEDLDLLAAAGVARQPATFFLPLPAFNELAMDRGLQTAWQGEVGARAELPLALSVETQLFVHRYENLLFPDLFLEIDEVCWEHTCIEVPFRTRVDGHSYGGEVFLARSAEEDLSGYVSYTLAWSEVDAMPHIEYTPTYDVRHVLNFGVSLAFAEGWSAGVRGHYRTGKPFGIWFMSTNPLDIYRYEQRLPAFLRMDARVAYSWRTSWGRMRATFEWLNVTMSREGVQVYCPPGTSVPPSEPCLVESTPAIFVPNIGIQAEL